MDNEATSLPSLTSHGTAVCDSAGDFRHCHSGCVVQQATPDDKITDPVVTGCTDELSVRYISPELILNPLIVCYVCNMRVCVSACTCILKVFLSLLNAFRIQY